MVSYSEAIWKASKARDTYGPIVDLVKKQQELARKTGLPTNISDEVLGNQNKSGMNKWINLKIFNYLVSSAR